MKRKTFMEIKSFAVIEQCRAIFLVALSDENIFTYTPQQCTQDVNDSFF